MKTAVICYICKKIKKASEVYSLKLSEYVEDPDNRGKVDIVQNKVKICRADSKRLGYKVKTIKK